jgi:hypothetical protein
MELTLDQVIKGTRDAAAFLDCSNYPDAPEMASACRLAAHELDQGATGKKFGRYVSGTTNDD